MVLVLLALLVSYHNEVATKLSVIAHCHGCSRLARQPRPGQLRGIQVRVGGDALPPKPTVPPSQYTNSWTMSEEEEEEDVSVVCFYLVSGGDIRIRTGTLVVTAG